MKPYVICQAAMPSHLPSSARHAVLAPLDRRGRVAEVERRLADAIQGGVFGDGDQLPSEAELAAQLGVATVTLREALVGLRRTGLVRTRRGRNGGTFVHAPAATAHARLLERLAELSVDDLRDLADHRAAIAGAPRRWPPTGRPAPTSSGSLSTSSGSRAPPPTPSAAPPTRASTSRWPRRRDRSGSRGRRWSCRPRPARSCGSRAARTAATARSPTTARCSPPCMRGTPPRRASGWSRTSRAEMAAVVALHLTRGARACRRALRPLAHPAARRQGAGGRGARPRPRALGGRVHRRRRRARRGARAARPAAPRRLGRSATLVHATLARRPLLAGTGMVFAPGALADAPRWLEWWQQRAARRAGLPRRDPGPGGSRLLRLRAGGVVHDAARHRRALDRGPVPRPQRHERAHPHAHAPGRPRRGVPRRGGRRHRRRRDRGDRRRGARGARRRGRARQPPRPDHRHEHAAAARRHALARRRAGVAAAAGDDLVIRDPRLVWSVVVAR